MLLGNNQTFDHDSLIIKIHIIWLWFVIFMHFLNILKTKFTAASVGGLICVNSRCCKSPSNNTQFLMCWDVNLKKRSIGFRDELQNSPTIQWPLFVISSLFEL